MPTIFADCKLCGMSISPLGSYVKEGRLFMHLNCYMEPKIRLAKEEGINEKMMQEQERARLARIAEAEAAKAEADRQKVEAENAPRCAQCNTPMRRPGTKYLAPLHRQYVSEEAGKEPGKCKRCSPVVYDGPKSGALPEGAIAARTTQVVPPQPKPEEPRPITDRFQIIELE